MAVNNLKISQRGLNLIEDQEDLRLIVYLCRANRVSIGFGHVLLPKFDAAVFSITSDKLASLIDECQAAKIITAEAGQILKISHEQAFKFLENDTSQAGKFINAITPVPLNQNQFDALSSLIFNIGHGNYVTSTIEKMISRGDFTGAAEQFLVWNKVKVDGKFEVCEDLVRRRAQERALFLTPV